MLYYMKVGKEKKDKDHELSQEAETELLSDCIKRRHSDTRPQQVGCEWMACVSIRAAALIHWGSGNDLVVGFCCLARPYVPFQRTNKKMEKHI